jgi:hypothetical protein
MEGLAEATDSVGMVLVIAKLVEGAAELLGTTVMLVTSRTLLQPSASDHPGKDERSLTRWRP